MWRVLSTLIISHGIANKIFEQIARCKILISNDEKR
jgi:hypothetical protein